MTISVWRYSHLALAVSSFIFLALAAVTGVILSFQPVQEKLPGYRSAEFGNTSVAQAIPAVKQNFEEITDVSIDANQFVTVKGIDTSGESVSWIVDPANGQILGRPAAKNEFFQWVTALHRSLFLHETGRFFIGLASLCLLLITVSGIALVIQRQRGFKRFFTRVVKENFAQYYHVVLGRLSLIPIFLIAISGTYLSLVRFGVFPEKKIVHKIDFDKVGANTKKNIADFVSFRAIPLSSVSSIEFPFSDDPEDYYLLKLKDRELTVDQYTGEILSEVKYPLTAILTNLSLDIHTGRKSIVWAVILAIACINILFFIYSGFAITLKRVSGRTRNRFRASESHFIILTGSENGSTMRFAKAVYTELLKSGQKVFLDDLNHYTTYPQARQLIVLSSTYGLGDPPSNARKFLALLDKHPQDHTVPFTVLGFGSHAYPDFCRFAYDAHNRLTAQSWATALMDVHTVNDKSPEQFAQWFHTWSQLSGFPEMQLPAALQQPPAGLQRMTVTMKSALSHENGTFIIRLQPSRRARFTSGDLLAIYPANDHRERLYSIGRFGNEIQLAVRVHAGGLGSGYLAALQPGDTIQATINRNDGFHFPKHAPVVVMIANGTGIAPFLGMIDQNDRKTECYLYAGFRYGATFQLYEATVNNNIAAKQLTGVHVAYSREAQEKLYVTDLVERDADRIAGILLRKGVLMLCGSLAMEKDVIALLEEVCRRKTGKSISYYQSCGQVLSDCY